MTDEPGRAPTQLDRAKALSDVGRHDEAVAILRRLAAAEPDDAAVLCELARAYLGKNDHEAALETARRAVSSDPENEFACRLASSALGDLGRHREAIAPARQAVTLAPGVWQTHACMAVALANVWPRSPEARSAASHAVELAPSTAETHLVVGMVAAAAGDDRVAQRAYQSALAIDPQLGAAHEGLARLHLHTRTGIHGPAGLANASRGFATALRTNVRDTKTRHSLDAALRSFLSTLSYLVLGTILVCGRISLDSSQSYVRMLCVALLLGPASYATRYLSRLTPELRTHLRNQILHTRLIVPSVLVSCAAALVTAAACLPTAHSALLACAITAALSGRILLFQAATDSARRSAGLPRARFLSTGMLCFLTLALFATGLFFSVSAFAPEGNLRELAVSVVFFTGTVGLARVARRRFQERAERRRTGAHPPPNSTGHLWAISLASGAVGLCLLVSAFGPGGDRTAALAGLVVLTISAWSTAVAIRRRRYWTAIRNEHRQAYQRTPTTY